MLVALNMSATPQKATFDLSPQGLGGAPLRTLISSGASAKGNEVTLQPFGLLIASVEQ